MSPDPAPYIKTVLSDPRVLVFSAAQQQIRGAKLTPTTPHLISINGSKPEQHIKHPAYLILGIREDTDSYDIPNALALT